MGIFTYSLPFHYRDSERAKKMRQIMSELQLQEGEVKKMKKKK